MTPEESQTELTQPSTNSYNITQKLRDGTLPYKPCYKFYKHICELTEAGSCPKLSDLEKQVFYFVHRSLTDTYFVLAPKCQRVKIGRSMNAKRRLQNLNQQCPEKLELLGYIQYDYWLEGRVHSYLADYREHGEWFKECDEVLSVLKNWRESGADWLVKELGDADRYWMNSPNRNKSKVKFYHQLVPNC